MIPFEIVYRRPQTIDEAVAAWLSLPEGSVFYSGGTEIVTGSRTGTYRPEAIIDVKGLPECRARGLRDSQREGQRAGTGYQALYFGSALSLNELVLDPSFPLLSVAVRKIADHSVRNRITLGGNVAGRLPYREALLPFLAADGVAHLAGPAPSGVGRDSSGGGSSPGDSGPVAGSSAAGSIKTGGGSSAAGSIIARRDVPLRELHAKRLQLRPGEFLLGLSIDRATAGLPFFHDRATAGAEVDYPILALCAIARAGRVSVALSGYLDYPVWVEAEGGPPSPDAFPPPRSDARASGEYRAELLRLGLARAAEALK
jgi:CO/xanthine dehydrogenase FAD-binding subunit